MPTKKFDFHKFVTGRKAKPKSKRGKWSWESAKGVKRRKITSKIRARREQNAKRKGVSYKGRK